MSASHCSNEMQGGDEKEETTDAECNTIIALHSCAIQTIRSAAATQDKTPVNKGKGNRRKKQTFVLGKIGAAPRRFLMH